MIKGKTRGRPKKAPTNPPEPVVPPRVGARALTTGEVATACGVSGGTVNKWLRDGLLPHYRLPGSSHRRVRRADLVVFMQKHGIPAERLPPPTAGVG